MGNRSGNRPPRRQGPVNPGQHELMIMRQMMEEAIATRVRVEDAARQIQGQLQEAQLMIAGLLLQREDHTAVLDDDSLEELSRFAGFDVDRDDETGSLTIRLILAALEDDDEGS